MILQQIQSALKAPKSQFNQFGKYKYRNCEDILEAVKPLLSKHNVALIVEDDLVMIGTRYYVKATARLIGKDGVIAEASAYAREAESKRGMDESQLTGATSSYARKYALNGLLAIDDTKDSDATNTHDKPEGFISKEQMENIIALIDETETDLDRFLKHMKAADIDKITKADYTKAVAALEAKKKAAK